VRISNSSNDKFQYSSSSKSNIKAYVKYVDFSIMPEALRFGRTYLDGVKLNTGLHHIHWGKSTVCERTTDTTSGSSFDVVHVVILGEVGWGRGEESGTGGFHGGHTDILN
jgi:hypothetical protein